MSNNNIHKAINNKNLFVGLITRTKISRFKLPGFKIESSNELPFTHRFNLLNQRIFDKKMK